MLDRRSQTVVRNIEIEERAPHKDPGGMNLLVECVLAVNEENIQAFASEEASTLETGESRADDGYVVTAHKTSQKSFASQSHRKRLRLKVNFGQGLYEVKMRCRRLDLRHFDPVHRTAEAAAL